MYKSFESLETSEKREYNHKKRILKRKTSKDGIKLSESERNFNNKNSSDTENEIKENIIEKTPPTLKRSLKVKNVPKGSIPNKKNKLKINNYSESKKQLCNPEYDREGEKSTKKQKIIKLNDDSYRPGMISDMIQIKKFGHLILPWDPSYGSDPVYRKNYLSKKRVEEENGSPKLEVNPLFDLSRQNDENKTSANKLENAVFVGNLPDETKIIKVKKLFRKFGLILHAKFRCNEFRSKKMIGGKELIKNKHEGRKNVNALIQFSNYDSCNEALKMNGKLYKGHHLRVSLAKDEGKSDPTKSVFVGNIAFKAQDEDLWKAFEDCGAIESVRILRDKRSGKGKGYGYVNFKTADSVELALRLDGTLVLDRNIRVSRNQNDVRSLSNNLTVKRRKTKRKLVGISTTDKQIKVKQKSITDQEMNENKPEKPFRVKPTQKLCKHQEKVTESSAHKKVKKKKNMTADQTTTE